MEYIPHIFCLKFISTSRQKVFDGKLIKIDKYAYLLT